MNELLVYAIITAVDIRLNLHIDIQLLLEFFRIRFKFELLIATKNKEAHSGQDMRS